MAVDLTGSSISQLEGRLDQMDILDQEDIHVRHKLVTERPRQKIDMLEKEREDLIGRNLHLEAELEVCEQKIKFLDDHHQQNLKLIGQLEDKLFGPYVDSSLQEIDLDEYDQEMAFLSPSKRLLKKREPSDKEKIERLSFEVNELTDKNKHLHSLLINIGLNFDEVERERDSLKSQRHKIIDALDSKALFAEPCSSQAFIKPDTVNTNTEKLTAYNRMLIEAFEKVKEYVAIKETRIVELKAIHEKNHEFPLIVESLESIIKDKEMQIETLKDYIRNFSESDIVASEGPALHKSAKEDIDPPNMANAKQITAAKSTSLFSIFGY